MKKEKVIGIVGGMGPLAGLLVLEKILLFSEAKKDQHHLPVMLMSFPNEIPDRTLFVNGIIDTNPAFAILKIINKMEAVGVDVVGIACNTSYSPIIYNAILEELNKANSKITLVNMPLETCKILKCEYPNIKRVGLMTTNGTYKSQIYKRYLEEMGYEVVLPDNKFQNDVIHRLIYDDNFGIKANTSGVTKEAKALFYKSYSYFQENNTESIVFGCTDLTVLLDYLNPTDIPIIDSTTVLANSLIKCATVDSNQYEMKIEY